MTNALSNSPLFTQQHRHRRRGVRRWAQLESLERREVLAATSITPAILGTVYQDDNTNSQPDAGEGLSGVTVRAYLDDGDGIFEPGAGDTQVGADLVTDANGEYCFADLDPDSSYFILQPAQTVGGLALPEQSSALTAPGDVYVLIDSFITTQTATASPPAPSNSTAVLTFANETEVIGRERDILSNLDTGDGEVRVTVNPFASRETLRYNSDVAVTGSGTITWDGIDVDASVVAMGLSGRDLTNGGEASGIALRIGAVTTGATATVRLYQGSDVNFSQATLTIPVTTGGAATSYEFIPFSDFLGTVSAANVDAIQLILDANASGANDIEVGLIGANGPKTADFAVVPGVDLSITKTDNRADSIPGESLTYTVTATNNGPSDVVGATITDTLPAVLLNPTYTSTTTGTVTGNTSSGSGDIADTVNMTAGSTVVYTITGTVAADARGTITNTAAINAPQGLTDSNPNNNNAVDVDNLIPTVDLTITKTDNVTTSQPGRQVTYVITVTNDGPSDVNGAVVEDLFPATLTNVSYTSTTTGTVVGNSSSGDGDISDTVDMTVGSTIVYTVSATVAANATGAINNTATVTAPNGTTEVDTANNSASDIDSLEPEVDLAITKTDNVTNVAPGDVLTYEIVVSNDGPADAVNATVEDQFPASLTNVSFTSTGSAGVTGNTASGTGNISDTVTLPAGGTLTYLVSATVANNASGNLTNTATVTAPNGTTETLLTNNTATDIDTVTPTFDLSITKDDGRTSVVPGQTTTYTIVVTNSGPSDVSGATVTDNFPAALSSVSYTSTSAGGATGNSATGTGDISDTVDLPAGSSITYVATATVAPSASGSVTNTATVSAPTSQAEADVSNNTATDIDAIGPEADLAVTKTDNRTTVSPGQSLTYQIVVTN
ncbi:MAG: DUF11 domain-containing protein, partial [Planctomycetales bacterium]|nr:DUF11 domain-containing protein [Planctomycetales bacterium]